MYVSTQLLLAGADDSPHHRHPEAAVVDVSCHFVVIIFRLLIPPFRVALVISTPWLVDLSSTLANASSNWVYSGSITGND